MQAPSEIEGAIAALEGQRHAIGDAATDAAIAALRASADAVALPPAERKHVTVMFADLSGFTALSERADPETVRDLVNTCFARMGEAVERFGGYIDKFIGDEMMVLFGAPQAMEDHASRALHAAIGMLASVEALNREHAGLTDGVLAMHIGVNSGVVIAGEMGTAGRRQYTVMGDTVNVAARLRTSAAAGDILAGADTRRLVGPGFQFESLGQRAVDGRARPVEVYRLTGAEPRAAPAREARETPMFGRRDELAVLQRAYGHAARTRRANLVSITGAAGIGKSRLLSEFRSWLRTNSEPEVFLRGAALPHMAATPYFVAGEIVRQYMNVHEGDSAEAIRGRLRAALARIALERPDALDALLALMGHEPEGAAFRELAPRARKALIFQECGQLMRYIASQGPAVIVFEDTHWADELSMELLRHLAVELVDTTVLFLMLSRPPADSREGPALFDAFERGRRHAVALTELDGVASRELVLALVPDLDRWPDAVDAVVSRGQGNPFFIQSIVGSLLDRGVLARGRTPARDEIVVPPTIWGVLAERIDRLPPREKRVLQAAAIVGRVFWEELVRELADEGESVPFEALRERDFIDSRGHQPDVGDREWAFRHVLVQEVAYSGLLSETRHRGHLAAAAWIERRCGPRRDEYASLLAHHYSQAEDWSNAASAYEIAGQRAAAIDANQEARDAFFKALDALRHLEQRADVQRRVVDITLSLAKAAFYAPYETVGAALQHAGELAAGLEDAERAFRVKTSIATYYYMTGREQDAVSVAFECLGMAASRPELEAHLSVPYHVVALAMFVLGNYGSCIEMLAQARRIDVEHPETAWAYGRTGIDGIAHTFLGNVGEGEKILADAAVEVGTWAQPAEVANVNLFIASADIVTGRYRDGGNYLRAAIDLGAEGDNRTTQYLAEGLLGHWLEHEGDLVAAREHFERAMALAAQLDSVMFVPFLEAYFALLDLREGNFETALERADHAVAFAQRTQQMGCEAEARRVAAWCRLYSPAGEMAAREEFQRSIDLHRRTGANALLARTLFDFAGCLDAAGDAAAATAARDEAETLAARHGLAWLPAPRPVVPAERLAGSGRP